jgi:hypothetical protein
MTNVHREIAMPKDILCVQIPTHSGQVFRFEAGRASDLKPATIPN